ncbi:MAG: iron-sulfur cluster assembly accessory protein [Anaerolineales bacterium]|nr:iron-sulfur cluster assembly accessory protein [Anaerolineales bacterium]
MSDLLMPTMPDEVSTEPEIKLMPAAVAKLREILAARNLADSGLRVFVSGGGCAGMQYGMAIEKEPSEFDSVFEQDGVRIFVDPTSMMYLSGSSIDYVDNLMGGGFRIDNPNAVASCGCGHSFRTSSQATPAAGGGCGCH